MLVDELDRDGGLGGEGFQRVLGVPLICPLQLGKIASGHP